MNVWALVPVKPFTSAKTRLSAVLTQAEREALAQAMLQQVLSVTAAHQCLHGVMTVSRDAEVLTLVRGMGADVLQEPTQSDLNAALTLGAAVLNERGASHALMLPADLPFITARDVDLLLEWASERDVVIAPDREHSGTNALLVPLPLTFSLQYGLDSFYRHLQAARRAGLRVQVVESRTLALDVDTPSDLDCYNQRAALADAPRGLPLFLPASRHA
jgi:2-phospho-L-lactate guanylyltransferase